MKVSLRWQGAAVRNLAGVEDLAFTLCRGLLHMHSAQPTVVGQILGQERLAGGGVGMVIAGAMWGGSSSWCLGRHIG